ncbi:MAG: glycosyltransferase 87 family protein [Phycisphaerae bacterium]|nr:glycosyltransferase 87 family protein [Phycisphaerae bacterium]
MRRWIILLAVMELAVLAIYLPGVRNANFHLNAAIYPESTVQPERNVDGWIDPAPNTDTTRGSRAMAALAAYGVLAGCWLVALYWLSRCDGKLDRRTLTVVLVGAGVLAISLWLLPPTFSDDSYRYRWEGLSATSGVNPYQVKPDECGQLRQSHPQLYWATDFRWRPSIYPPVCTFIFSINAILGNTLLGLRLILLAAEGLLAYSAISLLRSRGVGLGWAAGMLLCPLLIIETHLDAHVEIVPVAVTLAAVAALGRGKWWQSAMLFALAVSMKYLWPALAAFLLLGRLARQRRLLAGAGVFVLTTILCWMPIVLMDWSASPDLDRGMEWASWMPTPAKFFLKAPREFLEKYNYNATFYKVLVVHFPPESRTPQLAALGLLLAGVGALVWRRRWRLDIEDIALVLGLALLISPVSYPWYFLWLTPAIIVLGRGELWPRVGPPTWAVMYLAMIPAVSEYLPTFFRTGRAEPFAPIAWLTVAAVTPLLVAAWARRLAAPPDEEHWPA